MSSRNSFLLMFLIGFLFVFVVTGAMAIWYHQLVYRTSAEGGEPGMQERYQTALQGRISEQEKLSKVTADLKVLRQKLKDAQDEYRNRQHELARVDLNKKTYRLIDTITASKVSKHRDRRSDIEAFLASGDPLNADTTAYVKEGLRKQRNEQGTEYGEELSRLQAQISDMREQISEEQEKAERKLEEFRGIRSKYETELNQARDELRKFTARERQTADVIADGSILKTDYETKIAIIDIGSSNGVKRGYRFEVFQIRAGVHRESKGFLEVKTVNPETSTCIMLERDIDFPRCPVCGYVAHLPEELYCPYCSGGTSGIGVQKLSASPKKVTIGINPDNPIAADDLVWNPLFGGAKGNTIVYKGDPLLPNRFSRHFIEDIITWYGNGLEKDISAEVDLVVAGKLATDAVDAARELGIPIIYEFELFPFLRR